MSLYSIKRQEQQSQQWIRTWTPGPNLANLFNLYPSLGDKTYSYSANGALVSFTNVLDGPILTTRFGALTINADTGNIMLTPGNRGRGWLILCESLTMQASGSFVPSISMTARGAAGSADWANQDVLVPSSIVLSGQNTSYGALLAYLAATGHAIIDPTLFKRPPAGFGDVTADYALWPGRGVAIISAAGCGARTNAAGAAGTNGGTGAGGGGGRYNNSIATFGGEGRPWGGGSGGGGVGSPAGSWAGADRYGGEGGEGVMYNSGYYGAGGSGNPGGPAIGGGNKGNDGTGGSLIIICRGNITRNATDSITAKGVDGAAQTGGSYPCGGGASGGGHISLIYGGTYTGTGNTTASGGTGGAGTGGAGSAGGAGSIIIKTFAAMGWVQ